MRTISSSVLITRGGCTDTDATDTGAFSTAADDSDIDGKEDKRDDGVACLFHILKRGLNGALAAADGMPKYCLKGL